jgi:Fur family ferric uptake transcriptional regulator
MSDTRELLKASGLRITPCREALTDFFHAHGGAAFSFSELERMFSAFDRATVFRTLKTLLETGLVHKTSDDEGVRYAWTRLPQTHAHFRCNACGTTMCMDTVAVRPPVLPDGFLVEYFDLVATGTCQRCTPVK